MAAVVRSAETSDLDRIVAISAACFSNPWGRESYESDLARSWTRLLVAVDESQQVIGFVHYWIVAGDLEVMNVAVDPVRRRSGHARGLITAMLDHAHEIAAQRVTLEVRATNVAAIALYGSFGFVESGRRSKYYDDGEDALIMEVCTQRGA